MTTVAPKGGMFEAAQMVTLTADEPATLTWTLDGSDPLTSGSALSASSPAAVSVETSLTLRFFAADAAGNKEALRSESYTILSALTPAIISGTVHVAERLREWPVYVSIITQGTRGPTLVKRVVLGTAAADELPFAVDGLLAGQYYVMAGVDYGADDAPDNDILSGAPAGPFALDPADEAKKKATGAELWIGLPDPSKGSIEGAVALGGAYLNLRPTLVVYDQKPTQGVQPVAVALAESADEQGRAAFIVSPLSTGDYHVFAAFDPAGDGLGVGDDDEFIPYHANPVTVDADAIDEAKRHVSGIVIWAGTQNPELGHVAGTLALSAPLPTGTAFVVLLDAPVGQHKKIVGYADVDITGGATSFPYALMNVPLGLWYAVAVVENSKQQQALGIIEAPLQIAAGSLEVTGVDFTVGTGTVSGTITVSDPAGTAGKVLVLLVPAGTTNAEAGQWFALSPPDTAGKRTAPYDLFGAPDGTFDMWAVLDKNNDRDYRDDLNAGNYTQGAQVTVTGGVAPTHSDFTF